MPMISVEGRPVQVDDSFLKLSSEQQNATVDEIAKSLLHGMPAQPKKYEPALSDAVTDIPHEIGSAFGSAVDKIAALKDRGKQGPIDGLLTTGKAIAAVPELIMSPITGAVRSLVGHPLAQAEHAVGTMIAPETAAKDDPKKMYDTAKGDVDLAMAALGGREVPAVAPKPVAPTIAELKQASSAGYQSPAITGLEVKPASIADFAGKTKAALDAGGIDENLAPKTHAILTKLEKVPDSPASVFTGNNILSLRQLLGNAAAEPGKEGLAASRALRALDEHVPAIEMKDVIAGDPKAAAETLAEANANYSAAKHAETIDNKTIRAELRAASTNSGHNVANTIRQRMADILNPERPDLQRGFSPDELGAMEQIVRGTKTQNALRWAGNYLGGGGGLGALHTSGVGAAAGAAVAGPVGAMVGAAAPPIVGHILKAMGNRGTLNDAAALSEMIRSRAPLASSSQKFEEAASAFQAMQNPRTVAGLMVAARNLSNNLQSVGLNVLPSELLGGVQSPGGASAKDQQNIPRPVGQ